MHETITMTAKSSISWMHFGGCMISVCQGPCMGAVSSIGPWEGLCSIARGGAVQKTRCNVYRLIVMSSYHALRALITKQGQGGWDCSEAGLQHQDISWDRTIKAADEINSKMEVKQELSLFVQTSPPRLHTAAR